MTIINDQIIFDVTDIVKFSSALQADIAFRAGVTPSHEYLSARVNAVLEEATFLHNKDRLVQAEFVCLAYTKADATTQMAIHGLLGLGGGGGIRK